jgi:GTP-binding protein YchF
MEAGIVGLPNVGKSTLFNALTAAGAESANYPFCTIEPNVGILEVPDDRLRQLNEHIATQKIIPAIVKLVDIAGLVKGASKGEGRGNQFLSNIRNVDAICHVVRCFEDEDVAHVDGDVDPLRDIETIDTELMLADLQTVENSMDKAKRSARTGDKEAKARLELLEAAEKRLAQGEPIRGMELSEDQAKLVRGLGLITAKRALYVANVGEDDLHGESEHVQKVRRRAEQEGGGVVAVCAKIESELIELDETDRAEMLADLGLSEPALATLAREAYRLLGLQSFFTAGPKEIRAWTIPVGATAPQAAGVIHTDFEKKFIRAQVYTVDDLTEHGSEAAIKAAGKLRAEGKDYVVQDGDVCHFLTGA